VKPTNRREPGRLANGFDLKLTRLLLSSEERSIDIIHHNIMITCIPNTTIIG